MFQEMAEEEKKRIIAGIAEYKHEREVIKRVLKRHGRLSTTGFDAIFGDTMVWIDPKTGISYQKRPRPKLRFIASRGESFLLGDIFDAGYWSRWLNLIQFMCLLDIVHLEKKEMHYSLKEKGGD